MDIVNGVLILMDLNASTAFWKEAVGVRYWSSPWTWLWMSEMSEKRSGAGCDRDCLSCQESACISIYGIWSIISRVDSICILYLGSSCQLAALNEAYNIDVFYCLVRGVFIFSLLCLEEPAIRGFCQVTLINVSPSFAGSVNGWCILP